MFGWTECVSRAALRRAAVFLAGFVVMSSVGAAAARAETRTLKLYHVHLNEKTEITYKKDGKFLPEGLKKANWALRDWRENKPTNMDPNLLDVLWEAYRQSGSRSYIHIIGGYRSSGTNAMLRSRSSGVAGNSLHMAGKAVDWYLPDVPLKKLRDIGLRMQIGGVGYYPRSGSPFVHYDTGKGRYWPRMSRSELAAVFPKGNTIHLPADGKPLPGYETALASYNKRKGSNDIQIASSRSSGGRSLLAMLFGGGNEEAEDEAEASAAPVGKPSRAPAPARAAPKPEPEVQVASALPTRPAPPPALPAGVPMAERDVFDSSAPRRSAPPAAIPAAPPPRREEEDETEVAALAPSRVPLPSSAPDRPSVQALDQTLVAALEEAEPPPAAPAQLAYAVPMPRERPPFEAVLRGDQAALPTQKPELAEEEGLTPEAIIAAAMPEVPPAAAAQAAATTPTPAVAVAGAAPHVATPSARPQSAIAAAMTRPSETPDAKPGAAVQVASLGNEPTPARSGVAAAVAAAPVPAKGVSKTATKAPAKLAKGGRVVGDAPAASKAARKVSPDAIEQRIAIASLITSPERRAIESKLARPVADNLIGQMPSAVFARGFSRKGSSPAAAQHFEGTAVNFLPVHKLD
ncbi:hypothetical protein NS226_11230 [Aureimonas ureilytica]|uniref:Murein endopeptidase K n=1 Tax=Aureimonas ureilytica TaxID=401562 RepID=A0A175R7H8_9HYPH|nr:DUF882 domain-containing protein [Aureimonas ureilytica]KTQ95432.1 hypothetical protein NS226_11230 [Aureimonas ureilytica]